MTDDIVTRLRHEVARCRCAEKSQNEPVGKPFFRCESCDNQLRAAEEIERLRAEIDSKDAQAYRHMRRLYDERGDEIARLEAEIRELGQALSSTYKSRDRAIRALTEAVRGD